MKVGTYIISSYIWIHISISSVNLASPLHTYLSSHPTKSHEIIGADIARRYQHTGSDGHSLPANLPGPT